MIGEAIGPIDEKLGTRELEEFMREKAAYSSAIVLESIGDIPAAEVNPPENVLFVCKLNPATESEDLHTIFSRCGPVISAEVIRCSKTRESLCYAFIEFESKKGCERAYKMKNVWIDDRRIHVDFCQSVSSSKLWFKFKRKDSQNGKESVDHVAKDRMDLKYIVNDHHNMQHWRGKGYEMVFESDLTTSLKREKKREHIGHHDIEKIHWRSCHSYNESKTLHIYDTEDKVWKCNNGLSLDRRLAKRKERYNREDESISKRRLKRT